MGGSVFISAPAISRVTGARSFFLTRRIDGPDGAFLGLVISPIDIRYLKPFTGDCLAGGWVRCACSAATARCWPAIPKPIT